VLRKMRSKETEADYRYFREPDLLPLVIDDEWKARILADFPELPLERRARFMAQYGLPEYDADILTTERALSDYYEAALQAYNGDPKRVSNWVINEVLRLLNERGLSADQLKVTPQYLAMIIRLVDKGTVNTSTGKALVVKVEDTGKPPKQIVEEEGLAQVSDTGALRAICEKIIAANPKEVEKYRGGKTSLIGWFVGQVMRETRGKANPKEVQKILRELLG